MDDSNDNKDYANIDWCIDNLFKREDNLMNIYKESIRLEFENDELINCNLLNQLENDLKNIDDLFAKTEFTDKITDNNRIQEFYEKKNDLFNELIESAKFYETSKQMNETRDENKQFNQNKIDLILNQIQDKSNDDEQFNKLSNKEMIDKSKKLLNQLEECDDKIIDCYEMLTKIESKYK